MKQSPASHSTQIDVPFSTIDIFTIISPVQDVFTEISPVQDVHVPRLIYSHKLVPFQDGWVSSAFTGSEHDFVLLCDTLPRRLSCSFIAWNKQLPSLWVGSWRYASPAFPISNSLVIHCCRNLIFFGIYRILSVSLSQWPSKTKNASLEYFSLNDKTIIFCEISLFSPSSDRNLPLHTSCRDHLRSHMGIISGPGSFTDPSKLVPEERWSLPEVPL